MLVSLTLRRMKQTISPNLNLTSLKTRKVRLITKQFKTKTNLPPMLPRIKVFKIIAISVGTAELRGL